MLVNGRQHLKTSALLSSQFQTDDQNIGQWNNKDLMMVSDFLDFSKKCIEVDRKKLKGVMTERVRLESPLMM